MTSATREGIEKEGRGRGEVTAAAAGDIAAVVVAAAGIPIIFYGTIHVPNY